MPTLLALQAEAILDAASRSNVGIIVHAPDATALHMKQVLYRFRKELGNGAYRNLQIILSPDDPDHRVWIIRRDEEYVKQNEGMIEEAKEIAAQIILDEDAIKF